RLTFDVAHAQRSAATRDSLNVYISTDCGSNWTLVYAKGRESLATRSSTSAFFVPDSTDWRKEEILLINYFMYPAVQFKFENESDWGNNIDIDNINIENITTGYSNNNIPKTDPKIVPNPASGIINVRAAAETRVNFILEI